jgi:hypothetical protein
MKKIILSLICCAILACSRGSTSTPDQLELSKYSRQDLCCSVTLKQLDAIRWEAFGCGKLGIYKLQGVEWKRIGKIQPGPGSIADKLPVCNQ